MHSAEENIAQLAYPPANKHSATQSIMLLPIACLLSMPHGDDLYTGSA